MIVQPTRTLAGWVASQPLPPDEVRHQVRRSMLDYLTAAVVGAATPVVTTVRAYAGEIHRGDEAWVIGGGRLNAPGAALVNGTAAHGMEIDDGYTPGSVHPGAVSFPAVLAVAERDGLEAEDAYAAAAIAIETTCRVAAAGHPDTWRRGFHNTAVAGVLGAVAGACAALRLDMEAVESAFGVAASHAGGLFAFVDGGGEVKRLHAGKAARDGVISADLAGRGLTGPSDVLERAHGYFDAIAGDSGLAASLVDGLGERWTILRTYVKPYPCCRHLHGPIEAALTLRASAGVTLADVESVEVRTYTVASRHGHTVTADLLAAQMSIPYGVAVALRDGHVGVEQFDVSVRRDPDVVEFLPRVVVLADPLLDRRYPAERPALLTLRLRDGSTLECEVAQPLGEPDRALSDDELVEKWHRLAGPIIGDDRAARVVREVFSEASPAQILAQLAGPPA